MLRGQEACELTGIPYLHSRAFQEVADRTQCMISSRAVGRYATGLILEGYASKGFHNKAKSCNWGPMAGFVLTDPRFTKVGGTEKGQQDQKKALEKAFADSATAVPLFISDDRLRWLLKEGLINVTQRSNERIDCTAAAPWGPVLAFTLVRERPPTAAQALWGVCYGAASEATGFSWVMAVRDPKCPLPMSDYHSATTGDYDLFAVFARTADYRPDSLDRRMVSHGQLEHNIRSGAKNLGEDPEVGNITGRIAGIRAALNTAIQRRGYTGGNMVHHSDEGGRPFVGDVDLPVFAVVPGQQDCYALEDLGDMRQFIRAELGAQYAAMFNPGWMRELVFNQRGGDMAAALAQGRANLRPPPRG